MGKKLGIDIASKVCYHKHMKYMALITVLATTLYTLVIVSGISAVQDDAGEH
jgi:hypothetical protein